jgi:predicted transcriptional regulator
MPTVRISEASHQALKELADCEKAPLQTVLERAIENYRRQRFLEAANRRYAALREDRQTWAIERAERAEWDNTLGDGLNDE